VLRSRGWAVPSFRTVVVLCALAAFAAVATGITLSVPSTVSPATVGVLREDVFVRHGSEGYALAYDGEMLRVGDRVRTGPTGIALITYFDGSTVTLDPDSEIAIELLEISSTGRVIVLMFQTAGRAWYSITSALSPSSRYEVRTAATAAVVRAGSTVQVEVADAGDTTVAALDGGVDTGAGGSTVSVTSGRQTVIATGATPAPPTPATATPPPSVALAEPTTPPTSGGSGLVPKLALPTLPPMGGPGRTKPKETPPGHQKNDKDKRDQA
jgi:hypothetical protein